MHESAEAVRSTGSARLGCQRPGFGCEQEGVTVQRNGLSPKEPSGQRAHVHATESQTEGELSAQGFKHQSDDLTCSKDRGFNASGDTGRNNHVQVRRCRKDTFDGGSAANCTMARVESCSPVSPPRTMVEVERCLCKPSLLAHAARVGNQSDTKSQPKQVATQAQRERPAAFSSRSSLIDVIGSGHFGGADPRKEAIGKERRLRYEEYKSSFAFELAPEVTSLDERRRYSRRLAASCTYDGDSVCQAFSSAMGIAAHHLICGRQYGVLEL
eukprot:7378688-Prymnesium_polylepis.2